MKLGVYTKGKHNTYFGTPCQHLHTILIPMSLFWVIPFFFTPVNKWLNLLRTNRWWVHWVSTNHVMFGWKKLATWMTAEFDPGFQCNCQRTFLFQWEAVVQILQLSATPLRLWFLCRIRLLYFLLCYLNYSEQMDFSEFRCNITW